MTDLTGLTNQSAIGQIVVSSHQAVPLPVPRRSTSTTYSSARHRSQPRAPLRLMGARYVQSLFSGNYTDAVSSTFTDGSGSTDDVTLSGNTIKADGGSHTITPASAIDLLQMQTLQLDVWRTDETAELRRR